MSHYNLIARSSRFLYFDCNGILVSTMLNHSEEFISNTFYSLPFVKNEEEAQEILDIKTIK
jgi:hypothetical protein